MSGDVPDFLFDSKDVNGDPGLSLNRALQLLQEYRERTDLEGQSMINNSTSKDDFYHSYLGVVDSLLDLEKDVLVYEKSRILIREHREAMLACPKKIK